MDKEIYKFENILHRSNGQTSLSMNEIQKIQAQIKGSLLKGKESIRKILQQRKKLTIPKQLKENIEKLKYTLNEQTKYKKIIEIEIELANLIFQQVNRTNDGYMPSQIKNDLLEQFNNIQKLRIEQINQRKDKQLQNKQINFKQKQKMNRDNFECKVIQLFNQLIYQTFNNYTSLSGKYGAKMKRYIQQKQKKQQKQNRKELKLLQKKLKKLTELKEKQRMQLKIYYEKYQQSKERSQINLKNKLRKMSQQLQGAKAAIADYYQKQKQQKIRQQEIDINNRKLFIRKTQQQIENNQKVMRQLKMNPDIKSQIKNMPNMLKPDDEQIKKLNSQNQQLKEEIRVQEDYLKSTSYNLYDIQRQLSKKRRAENLKAQQKYQNDISIQKEQQKEQIKRIISDYEEVKAKAKEKEKEIKQYRQQIYIKKQRQYYYHRNFLKDCQAQIEIFFKEQQKFKEKQRDLYNSFKEIQKQIEKQKKNEILEVQKEHQRRQQYVDEYYITNDFAKAKQFNQQQLKILKQNIELKQKQIITEKERERLQTNYNAANQELQNLKTEIDKSMKTLNGYKYLMTQLKDSLNKNQINLEKLEKNKKKRYKKLIKGLQKSKK